MQENRLQQNDADPAQAMGMISRFVVGSGPLP
jgi:hypothetical protein